MHHVPRQSPSAPSRARRDASPTPSAHSAQAAIPDETKFKRAIPVAFSRSQEPTNARATICVIEDDPSVRRALRRLLSSFGYNVEAYEFANDVRTLKFTRPCCFVVDVRLNDMSAADLADLLDTRFPDVPILYITAYLNELTWRLTRRSNVGALLLKPFDEGQLLHALQQALAMQGI